jgi:hypothetical protein
MNGQCSLTTERRAATISVLQGVGEAEKTGAKAHIAMSAFARTSERGGAAGTPLSANGLDAGPLAHFPDRPTAQ